MATTTENAEKLDALKDHHHKWPVTVCNSCPEVVPGFSDDPKTQPCVFCAERDQEGRPVRPRGMRRRLTFDEWMKWREDRQRPAA